MFFTVDTLLEKFGDFRIVAGEAGAHEIVKNVYVADSPGISDWGQPRDFILTSGYIFREDPQQLEDIIGKLKGEGVSGLALKVDAHIGELPASVLKRADEVAFPLVDIPSRYRWGDIIPVVIRGVMEEDLDQKMRARIVSDLVFERKTALSFLSDAKRRLGCDFEGGVAVAVVVLEDAGISNSLASDDRSARLLEGAFLEAVDYVKLCHDRFAYGVLYDKLVLLLEPLADGQKGMVELRGLLEKMGSFVRGHSGQTVLVGLSSRKQRLADAGDAFDEARQALQLISAAGYELNVAPWDDLGVFTVLAPVAGTEASAQFVKRYLGPLQSHDAEHGSDLMGTVACLVRNDWNLKQSAAEGFMHYNTLRNKFQRILSILGLESIEGDDRLNIEVALKLLALENHAESR